MHIHIVGGGLAGSEASWQLLKRGHKVTLHEMRPKKTTAAHQTGELAELVCSNSLKSLLDASAPGELKKEMALLDSLIIKSAYKAKVPAGMALAVDRKVFSTEISSTLHSFKKFTRMDEEVTHIPTEAELKEKNQVWIIATGPLTSDKMAGELQKLCDDDMRLFFYDAIAPVISADSIDMDKCFIADRYGENGTGDYINVPLNKEEYETFIADATSAEKTPLHNFEKPKYFESCLPVEVMIERGKETLRFGPMKPVGLTNPHTGHRPWANIQLRKENVEATMYSMVGFQTKMKWPEQKRVFSKIPGLANAEFLKYGSIHRNTYLDSPKVLTPNLSFKKNSRVFLAGQITGVEGYTESTAIGLLAAIAVHHIGEDISLPPKDTMIGALLHHVTYGGLGAYVPMNTNLGLLPHVERNKKISKAQKKEIQCQKALKAFNEWFSKTLQPE